MQNKVGFICGVLALCALGLGSTSRGATDSWSHRAEVLVPFSGAITANTTALVYTGITSVRPNIRSAVITNTASGFVRIYASTAAGAAPVGADLVLAVGVIANTPLVLTEDSLGQSLSGVSGRSLVVDATTGTVSLMLRVRKDPP